MPRKHTQPFLFAIARDEGSLFASWNINWQRVFQKATPSDRQVHLRVIGDDGVERKRVAVEPMAAVHYLTISRLPDCSRVELGYFQPIDTWHSVAISNKIEIPPQKSAESTDVDLATIPFHVSFEQLANFFGVPTGVPLARVISTFQGRVMSSDAPNESVSADTNVLRQLNLSPAEIAVARRDFQKIKTEKLARRTRAIARFLASSPSRGFEENFRG